MGLNLPVTRRCLGTLCFMSQQPMGLPDRNNPHTICSPVQCHRRRAKPQQCGGECQSCVNAAAVRPSAANLAPLSLQQYHRKYSTHTITSVSLLTTGRIVTSVLLLITARDYSCLISHFTAESGRLCAVQYR